MTTENWVLFLHRLLKTIPLGLSAEAYWTLIPTMLVCTCFLSPMPFQIHPRHPAKPDFRTSPSREVAGTSPVPPNLGGMVPKVECMGTDGALSPLLPSAHTGPSGP